MKNGVRKKEYTCHFPFLHLCAFLEIPIRSKSQKKKEPVGVKPTGSLLLVEKSDKWTSNRYFLANIRAPPHSAGFFETAECLEVAPMRCKDKNSEELTILQRQYTAYLNLVLYRKRNGYLRSQIRRIVKETEAKQKNDYMSDVSEDDFLEGLPLLQQIENPALAAGLCELKERDRQILIAHAVEGKSYDELSLELGMPYKSVATIYYRALQKIRERMEQSNGF